MQKYVGVLLEAILILDNDPILDLNNIPKLIK